MDNSKNLNFTMKRLNLPKLSPCTYPIVLGSSALEVHRLRRALEAMSKAADLASKNYVNMELAMRQRNLSSDTLLYRSITMANLGITMPEKLSEMVLGITTQTKISQALEKSLSYLIMTHWKCIGRYSFAKEHLMLSHLEIEALPQWVKLLVPTKSMNYLNPHAKDILYCWTQMPRDMQSIWRSNLLPIKKSRWCFYQMVKM